MREAPVPDNLTIGDTVQGYSPGQAEILGLRYDRQRARQPKDEFLGHRLDGRGEVYTAHIYPSVYYTRLGVRT
jgi:hypothetical protein